MHLGIDFGTTSTVVACCDRGNYPVVGFADDRGDGCDFFPSLVAERDGELRFGTAARDVATDGSWATLRSFKRLLSGPDASPDLVAEIGGTRIGVAELLTRFAAALGEAIRERSNLPRRIARDDRMVAVVATPANARAAQRFVTLDAFRRAGFEVVAMLNEPSAAGFEYTHRHRSTLTKSREHIVVYDLGGGTFDASLVRMSGPHHDAIATAGLSRLGGDDFDAALADLALGAAGLDAGALEPRALAAVRERCREAKEALHPNTRRIAIDLEPAGAAEVSVPVAALYEACAPLIERTIETMRPVIARLAADEDESLEEIAGLYVVGGGSCLPAVGRLLRERFGRRVHRSPYPFAATAIGLAIASDERAGFDLEDRFSRNFGVYREAQGGRQIAFDPIFTRETRVPRPGRAEPVAKSRVYRAAHNVGHFRMIECADVDASGVPQGEITPVADVLFPFDPSLREGERELGAVPVQRTGGDGPLIQEQYSVDAHGIVELTITDLETGYERAYRVGARP